ncbi:hypothetical protein PM082_020760 [Marasmius tenuissimus]|nr:hypothetical protein PM082_020760 [Marasmius tenuissimus]
MSSEQPRPNQDSRDGNVQAAIARSATRAIALYYSRPVRFFRPSKVSGWQMLRGIASQDGVGLSPQFVRSLVQAQGFTVIAKHFVPPILVNTLLGTILFTTYTEATQILEPHIGHHPTLTAAVAGGIAGGAQALVAAPAENVRTLVEGGTVYHSWSHAWKDVFRGTETRAGLSKTEALEDVREVRRWMKEVGEMAGRGWNGWGWTCVKDISGFAVFFSMFSLTKRIAGEARVRSEAIVERRTNKVSLENIPRVLYGCLLVAGGVLAGIGYEFSTRPWEYARNATRLAHLHHLAHPTGPSRSMLVTLTMHFREDWRSFFRDPSTSVPHADPTISSTRRRFLSALKTLARVGPWGVSFLAWEIFGPTLDGDGGGDGDEE